jgi:hypothetical protein
MKAKNRCAVPLLLPLALLGFSACQRNSPSARSISAQSDSDPASLSLFRDMTASSGVDFTYRNGREAGHCAILESLGGGIALLDYDGDGLLDIFITGGGYFDGPDRQQIKGYPNRLYKNLGNWKFRDVTAEVGLDQPLFYGHGCAVADYNCDGWPDLLVTGWGRLALYRNVPDSRAPGGRRFVDVTQEAGLDRDRLWSTSAAWADLDGDGYPDLYVCHYVDWSFANHPSCSYHDGTIRDICPPRRFKALPHSLFRNNRDGTFTDVSAAAGLYQGSALEHSKGLGVLIVDLNGDGRPDIYVANDTTDNLLYINRGSWRFDEVGMASGVARDDRGVANGSMGVDAADFDLSGRPSLWVTNYQNENHALYRNDGRDLFTYRTQASGIAAIGQTYVGFGTGFLDLDNHGLEDLVIANGHVLRYPQGTGVRQRPVLLRNLGQGRFNDFTRHGGPYFQTEHVGRGLAIGDLDNDGRPDLVISHLNEPVVLLRNESTDHHWLGIELVGSSHRDPAGAHLTLQVGDRTLHRFAKGGGSYLSAPDRRHLFGLGSATRAGRLTVTWPSGQPRSQHWDNLPLNQYHRLVQGAN